MFNVQIFFLLEGQNGMNVSEMTIFDTETIWIGSCEVLFVRMFIV
jgi:hypothetical protein